MPIGLASGNLALVSYPDSDRGAGRLARYAKWAVWFLASAIWLWGFVFIGGVVGQGGIFGGDPSRGDRLQGAGYAAAGCAGPVLSLLLRRGRRVSALTVVIAAIAAAAVGAAFIYATTTP